MEENWVIDQSNGIPIYVQLKQQIIERIINSSWEAGLQLPTVRQLAVDLRINANTVARVYTELERDGYVSTQQGRGTFVRNQRNRTDQVEERQVHATELAEVVAAMASARGVSIEELITALEIWKRGRGPA